MELLTEAEAHKYAKIGGKHPFWLLDRHPDGHHVALQATDSPLNRGGVWETEPRRPFGSRRLVWEPSDAIAMAWTPSGGEIFVATFSETTYQLQRFRWPQLELLGSCPLHLPTGWIDWVGVSPNSDRVAVRWMEQDCAGFILVEAIGPRQIDGAGYETEPNWISAPVFTPDGRYIAISCGRSSWWNADALDSPSRGGTYEVGHVAVYRMDYGPAQEERLSVTIPRGWLPNDPESGEAEFLGEPHFMSSNDFTVALPNGQTRKFEVANFVGKPTRD